MDILQTQISFLKQDHFLLVLTVLLVFFPLMYVTKRGKSHSKSKDLACFAVLISLKYKFHKHYILPLRMYLTGMFQERFLIPEDSIYII